MAGLTLAVVLFLLLLVIPGYIEHSASGKKTWETNLYRIVARGTLVLVITFVLLAYLADYRAFFSNMLVGFYKTLMALSGVKTSDVELWSIAEVFGIACFVAFVVGQIDYCSNIGIIPTRKISVSFRMVLKARQDKIAKWLGIKRESKKRFIVSSNVLLKDVMLAYSLAGRWPYVKIHFKNGQDITGVILRYSWAKEERF